MVFFETRLTRRDFENARVYSAGPQTNAGFTHGNHIDIISISYVNICTGPIVAANPNWRPPHLQQYDALMNAWFANGQRGKEPKRTYPFHMISICIAKPFNRT